MNRDPTPGPSQGAGAGEDKYDPVEVVRTDDGAVRLMTTLPAGLRDQENVAQRFGQAFNRFVREEQQLTPPLPDPEDKLRPQGDAKIGKLLGRGGFLETERKPAGFEFFRPFDSTQLLPANITGEEDTVGVLGGMVGPMAKSDETLLKLVQNYKYIHGEDDFVQHCRDVVGMATVARATQHVTNFVLYMSIQPPARNFIGDLMPGNRDYAAMSTQDYIDALALRLCDVAETKMARKEYYLLQQGKGEGASTFFFKKVAAYKKAFPTERRDIIEFCEQFSQGLINKHLTSYLNLHLSEMHEEKDILETITKGILFVLRQIECGQLPRSESYGLKDSKRIAVSSITEITEIKKDASSEVSEEVVASVTTSSATGSEKTKENDLCYYCGKSGHYARACFRKQKDMRTGSYRKTRPTKLNHIHPDNTSESDSSDSEVESIVHLIQNGKLDRKKGRRVVRKLTREKEKKSDQAYVNSNRAVTDGNASDGVADQLSALQLQIMELQEKVDTSFLGTGSEGKISPLKLKSKK